MATILSFQASMTPQRALKKIRDAVGNGLLLGWSTHALEKLGEEIVMRQVLTVLEEGPLKKGPTWSEEFEDWVACCANPYRGEQYMWWLDSMKGGQK